MRFLCNENIPWALVKALEAAGHDVRWVRNEQPGIPDQEVLRWASRESRVCLTFDKDFGELAAREHHGKVPAVILLRVPPPVNQSKAEVLVSVISKRDDWEGNFAVVEPGRMRLRALPKSQSLDAQPAPANTKAKSRSD